MGDHLRKRNDAKIARIVSYRQSKQIMLRALNPGGLTNLNNE
jgi:hypothetical protein